MEQFKEEPQLTLLHCVWNYPAKFEDINLKTIKTMKMTFHLSVELSDHTLGISVPIVTFALGACIIGKHLPWIEN